MTFRSLVGLAALVTLGCGSTGALPTSSTPDPRRPGAAGVTVLADEVVSRALVARFEQPYCEADFCLDPFPLWAVSDIAVSGDRIALAGPGALLSVFADGAWTTYVAPAVEGDEDPDQVALHAVAFSPDGAMLAVGGSLGRLYALGPEGLAWLHTLADGEREEPVTVSALFVAAPDDLFALGAYGEVARVRLGGVGRNGTEESRYQADSTLDRLISVGRPLAQRLVVSGPFRGFVIDDAFGEAPSVQPFYTDEQLVAMGEYSGCDTVDYDDHALGVYERTEELVEEGLSLAEATARAERETPPRSEDLPPAGVEIPSSGIPAPALVSRLAATSAGRAILPIASRPPTPGTRTVVARRGRSVAVAARAWPSGSTIWARLGARGFFAASGDVGDVDALDVMGDRLLVVGTSGAFAVLAPGDEVLTQRPASPLLAGPTAVHIVDDTQAWVATEHGRLVRIDLRTFEVTEVAVLEGVVHAIASNAADVYAVGDDGLVIRVREGVVTRIASGVSADLFALAVLGDRRLVVAGAAGTIAMLAEGEPRVLPRVTSDRVVEVRASGEHLFALAEHGGVLRVEGDHLLARPTVFVRYRSTKHLALRFAPSLEGVPFVARDTPLLVAVDGPDAIAPFGALSWDDEHDVFPSERGRPPSFLHDGYLEEAVHTWEGGACCDSDYDAPESERLLDIANAHDCDFGDCDLLTTLDLRHRLLSTVHRTAASIDRGTGDCPDLTLRVERMGTGALREVSRETIDCAAGLAAQQLALQARLNTLGLDATWQQGDRVVELPEALGPPSGVGFVARRARAGVEIVRSDRGNRRATVVVRLPRATLDESDPVALAWWVSTSSDADETDERFVAFEGPGFFWAGPVPDLLGEAEAAPGAGDEACTHYAVRDPDGGTTLRVGPTSRSDAAQHLPNGTEVHVARREGAWLAIDVPQRGWLYLRNLRCIE